MLTYLFTQRKHCKLFSCGHDSEVTENKRPCFVMPVSMSRNINALFLTNIMSLTVPEKIRVAWYKLILCSIAWIIVYDLYVWRTTRIAKCMGPTWGPPGSCRPQMGPILPPWALLLGQACYPISGLNVISRSCETGSYTILSALIFDGLARIHHAPAKTHGVCTILIINPPR